MKKRGGFRDYEYLSEDVIRKACSGDREALGKVIARYHQSYISAAAAISVQSSLWTNEDAM